MSGAWLRRLDAAHPVAFRVGVFHLLLFAVFSALLLLDPRELGGAGIWLKPWKFALSIAVYLGTVAWMASLLPGSRLARVVGWVAAVAMLAEQSLITMQAARGVASHYNVATAFDARVFQAMGVAIVVNTLALLVLLVRSMALEARGREAMVWGVRLGLAVFVAGSLEGFVMTSQLAHSVGGADGGPGIPLFRWSTEVGDLRVAHFLGIHAIQVLPWLGWLVDRRVARPGLRVALAWMLAAVYVALAVAALWLALSGSPGPLGLLRG